MLRTWTKLEISCFKNSEDLTLTDKLIIYPLDYYELTVGLIGVTIIELNNCYVKCFINVKTCQFIHCLIKIFPHIQFIDDLTVTWNSYHPQNIKTWFKYKLCVMNFIVMIKEGRFSYYLIIINTNTLIGKLPKNHNTKLVEVVLLDFLLFVAYIVSISSRVIP